MIENLIKKHQRKISHLKGRFEFYSKSQLHNLEAGRESIARELLVKANQVDREIRIHNNFVEDLKSL